MRIFVLTKRNLLLLGVGLLVLVALIVLLLGVGGGEENTLITSGSSVVEEYELEVLAGKQRELPVYAVARDDQKIALTIDVAWEDDKTPFILEELSKHNIKATFFVCGFWAKENDDIVEAIHASGHEIGNHTSTHPHMSLLDVPTIEQEVLSFDDTLEKITGTRTNLFRAPYGEYNDLVISTVRAMGYTPVQWSIDTMDWNENRKSDEIVDSVMQKLSSGSIILSHNNGANIETYLPTLIEKAKSEGYSFVTVGELLHGSDSIIDVNGVQKTA